MLRNPIPSRWKTHSILMSIGIIGLAFFQWGAPNEVPMGDAYIHFTYAKNLATYQSFTFNPGIREGIGSSSGLWVMLLGFFYVLGVSPVLMARILGGLLLLGCCLICFELTYKILDSAKISEPSMKAMVFSILAFYSGSLLWMASSGMETILFLMLSLASIWFYEKESWVALGICLGLATLTRTEGVILAGVMILIEIYRKRAINLTLVKVLISFVFFILPWILFLQYRDGAPIPNSLQGRQFVLSEIEERIADQFPLLLVLQKINPLVHIACWVYFCIVYLTSSPYLPGWSMGLGGNLVGTSLTIPLLGVLVGLLSLPIYYLAIRDIVKQIQGMRWPGTTKGVMAVIFSWMILFNVAFALFLPHIGAAGRYIPMNHMLFWVLLPVGVGKISNQFVRRFGFLLILCFYGIGLLYWRDVYRANIEYMLDVRIQAANYIEDELPDVPIGATDLGAIGYYTDTPVVDLFGHINKEVNVFLENGGEFADYISEKELCYLMLFGSWEGQGLDLAKEMGLYDDPRFRLKLNKSFKSPMDDWELGNGPIRNYMPVVNVFEIEWIEATHCTED